MNEKRYLKWYIQGEWIWFLMLYRNTLNCSLLSQIG